MYAAVPMIVPIAVALAVKVGELAGFPVVAGIDRFREAKVEHFHRTVRADLHVRRLQISMHDPELVRGLEGVGDLFRDLERIIKTQSARGLGCRTSSGDEHGQILALDEFHDEGVRRARVFKAIDGRDVGVVERCEHLRFTPKSRQPVRIGHKSRRQNLERDVAVELHVAGAIDLAHATLAQFLEDLVGAEARAWSHNVTVLPSRYD
jgi:hypothetical protein